MIRALSGERQPPGRKYRRGTPICPVENGGRLRRRSCEWRRFLINWAKDEAKHWMIDSLEIATNQTNYGGLESWHRTSPLGWEVGTYVG